MPGIERIPKSTPSPFTRSAGFYTVNGRSSDLFPNIRPSQFNPVVFRMLPTKTYSYGDSSGLAPDSLFIRPKKTVQKNLFGGTVSEYKGTAAKTGKNKKRKKIMKKL